MSFKSVVLTLCKHSKVLSVNLTKNSNRDWNYLVRCFSRTNALQFLDVRDKDHEKKKKELIVHQGLYFDEAAKKAKDMKTYFEALDMYIEKNRVHRRGHVEFLYAALNRVTDFNAHRDIETYRRLFSIFPKYKMIPKNVWQVEFMHYPKQQQCAIDILDYMEKQGVIPDDDMGYQLRDLFGPNSHVFRKYKRMMYWMPKFKFQSPYYVPYNLPTDAIELAMLALKRMSVDLETEISIFNTTELDTSSDKTFIVSAQSPEQISILQKLPQDESLIVEGGFTVRLRSASLTYFVLKSERNDNFLNFQEKFEPHDYKKATEKGKMNLYTFDREPSDYNKSILLPPSVHEQEDGTVLALCITGTSSKDSIASWIKFLERTNPSLSQTPVLLMLKSPTNELEPINNNNNKNKNNDNNNNNINYNNNNNNKDVSDGCDGCNGNDQVKRKDGDR